ncbi:tripartite tricarboxylate transporter permease [Chloroflexota bacterium]
MVIEAFGQALLNFLGAELWLFLIAGVIVGILFGIIPGIGSMLALALCLPFLFMLTAEQGLPLLMAIQSVIYIGGSITAILLGIPGTPTNAATVLDGYPMTQKGEAGRALGAALTSCGTGSIITAIVALALVPLLLPMVMALRSADMVFIILLGFTFIAALGEGSMVKALISAGVGILISSIGFQAVTAVDRFTFGTIYLYNGIPVVPLCLGIFGIPEAIALAVRGGTIAKSGVIVKGMQGVWQGVRDVFRHKMIVLQSSIIGFVIGIIPGIGAMISTFVAYGRARQSSKYPEKFGTGCVEGVIAPECANDAKEGGSLLITLALGIPGSAPMVLLLAAMMLLGLIPGPEMLTSHLELSLTLLLVILVASVVGVVICLPIVPHLAKISIVPSRILAPLVLVVIVIGTYAYQEELNDVIALLICGGVGIIMRSFGYNRPALILGYVLGRRFEKYLFIALAASGPLFFMRPISLILIFIIIALFTYGPIKGVFQRGRGVKKP